MCIRDSVYNLFAESVVDECRLLKIDNYNFMPYAHLSHRPKGVTDCNEENVLKQQQK